MIGRRVALIAVIVAVAGCSRPPAAAPPVFVPTIAPPSSTTAAAPTSTAPILPANCGAMVPGDQLNAVVGVPISAVINVIIGAPEPNIGRTGRITCRYGTPVAGVYPLEISLNSYGNAQQAVERVTVTVTAAERRGVGSSMIAAGGVDGRYLPLPEGGLVVASSGIYSVAVSVAPNVLPPDQVPARAGSVAGIVLAQAGV